MEPDDFYKLMRQAAKMAKRRAPTWLDTQDLTQAAELALLEARARGRAETITDPQHLENKTRQQLWGAMMDSIRKAWDGGRKHPVAPAVPFPVDSEGMPLDVHAGNDDPVRTVQLKRAIERFGRKGSNKQQEVVLLTAAGYDDAEIGSIMGLSASRICQLRAEAKLIMSVWGDL